MNLSLMYYNNGNSPRKRSSARDAVMSICFQSSGNRPEREEHSYKGTEESAIDLEPWSITL
jgi:hypothetical protein